MHPLVGQIEDIAQQISDLHPLSEAEQARMSVAAHKILNLTEPYPRADVNLVYQNR
jgi:hypothetical protein